MAQDFDLQLDGKSVDIETASMMLSFNTPIDIFSATITVDPQAQAKLYDQIKPFRGTPAQIYLDGELMLTGKLTRTLPNINPNSTDYKIDGACNTFNFFDSALTPPYEYNGLNLEQVANEVAQQTATKVITENPGGKFEKSTVTPGQTAYQFLKILAGQRSQVITNDNLGNVVIKQANTTGNPVGKLDYGESDTLLRLTPPNFDLRKRFKTWKVKSRTEQGKETATATDDNINEPRHRLVQADNQVKGALSETAQYALNSNLIDLLAIKASIRGWKAPNNTIYRPDTLLIVRAIQMFIDPGFTFFINSVKYDYTPTEKTCELSLIPKEIYTNETIKEPWS